jgi:hypothetical protein
MTTATFVITGASNPGLRAQFPSAVAEAGRLLVQSQLSPEASLNEHLVWLWGMLNHNRRALKRFQAEGAEFKCLCRVKKGPISVQPNGAEMLHLLGCELVVEVG